MKSPEEENTPEEKEVFRALNALYLEAPAEVCDSVKKIVIDHINKLKESSRPVLAEKEARIKDLESKVYLPNHWRCPKCKFYQVNSILAPDGIFADKRTPEQCPNDGTEMMPVSWKENAQDGREGQDRLMEIINKKEAQLSAQAQVIGRLMEGFKIMWHLHDVYMFKHHSYCADYLNRKVSEQTDECICSQRKDFLKARQIFEALPAESEGEEKEKA